MFCHIMAAFLGMAATLRLLVVTVPNLIFLIHDCYHHYYSIIMIMIIMMV